MGFPITYISFAMILFDIPADRIVSLLLSPFFYLVCILSVTSGYALWEMKRWAWYLFICTNVLIGYGNALLVSDYGMSQHKALAFVASIGFLVLLVYRVAREIRVPYFFPKIRWWESNPRYRLSVPAKVVQKTQAGPLPSFEGQILDLSLGGCFVKVRNEVGQDESLEVSFTVFGYRITCEGKVVWRTQSTVTHPRGVGVKFTTIERGERRKLKLITKRLKKISSFYRRARYLMNQEDFEKNLVSLETEGVMPKIPRAKGSA